MSMTRRTLIAGSAAPLAALAATAMAHDPSAAATRPASPSPRTTPTPDTTPTSTPAPTGSRRFEGQVVAITGATSGIGEAAARAFAAEGASVVFCGRREELGAAVEQSIRAAGQEASYVRADVREAADVDAFIAATVERHGGLDVLFANAGTQTAAMPTEITVEHWDDEMNTNARGVMLAIRAAIPPMIERGGGSIVVTSSAVATMGRPHLGVYQASKRAVLGLVAAAALQHGPDGIRVNAVLPGITNTPMIRPEGVADADWDVVVETMGRLNVTGLGRIATPAEIAATVLSLAAPDQTFLTGSFVTVDGGMTTGQPLRLG